MIDYFTVEEGAALLRTIWPNWPDMRNMQPTPKDLNAWLNKYREQQLEKTMRNHESEL